MKCFSTIAIIALVLPLGVVANAESYSLICRGGSSVMSGTLETYKDNGRYGHMITVKFRRGRAGSEPGKGECVWADRGLLSGEPSEFRYSVEDWDQTYSVGPGGMDITRGPMKYITDGVQGSQIFNLEVYNSGSGYLLVTDLDP